LNIKNDNVSRDTRPCPECFHVHEIDTGACSKLRCTCKRRESRYSSLGYWCGHDAHEAGDCPWASEDTKLSEAQKAGVRGKFYLAPNRSYTHWIPDELMEELREQIRLELLNSGEN
jgi:hypothetical protein